MARAGRGGPLAERLGMNFLSFPIQDVHVPASMPVFRAFVAGLAERLRLGEHVGMHCRGSIGRAPLTAEACTLIHLGWSALDALAAIEAARVAESKGLLLKMKVADSPKKLPRDVEYNLFVLPRKPLPTP